VELSKVFNGIYDHFFIKLTKIDIFINFLLNTHNSINHSKSFQVNNRLFLL